MMSKLPYPLIVSADHDLFGTFGGQLASAPTPLTLTAAMSTLSLQVMSPHDPGVLALPVHTRLRLASRVLAGHRGQLAQAVVGHTFGTPFEFPAPDASALSTAAVAGPSSDAAPRNVAASLRAVASESAP